LENDIHIIKRQIKVTFSFVMQSLTVYNLRLNFMQFGSNSLCAFRLYNTGTAAPELFPSLRSQVPRHFKQFVQLS